jgi:hypothetical protein
MQQDNSKNGEDFFKERFNDFTPPPPNTNRQKIASQLDGEDLDSFVKNNLSEIEPTPNPKIWANIKRSLPLSLLVRNQLNWLSGMAAILIIFMVAILFFNKKEIANTDSFNAEIDSTNFDDKKIVQEKNSDFVYAINYNNKKQTSASEELSLDDEKTLENFWSSIDEEEDFIADEEVIKNSLKPLLQLPIENLEAALPRSKKPLSIFQQEQITFPSDDVQSDEE